MGRGKEKKKGRGKEKKKGWTGRGTGEGKREGRDRMPSILILEVTDSIHQMMILIYHDTELVRTYRAMV